MRHKGSLHEKLFNLTWPIFIETSLIMLLGMGDIFMLGTYDDNAVAAVGVVNQMLNMVFLLFGVVTTGTSVLCARYLGMRQHSSVRQVVGVSILFNLLFSGTISFFLGFYAREIVGIMDLREGVCEYAVDYMTWVGSFAWLQAISLTISAILRSLQRPKFPMIAILSVNIVNIIGNYFLIFGNGPFEPLGVTGAAFSTVFSRLVSVLIVITALKRIVLPDLSINDIIPFRWNRLKELLQIGLPGAGEMLSYSLSQVTVTYFINIISNEALIARTYVVNIVMIAYLFAYAVAQSCSILVGFYIGEGHTLAAHRLMLHCSRRGIQVSLSLGLIIALIIGPLMGLFTQDSMVLAMAAMVVWIDVILEIGRALNMIVIAALRAAGDYIFPVAFGALSVWGIATGMSWVLGITWGLGLTGVWIAFAADDNIRGVIMLHRWNRKFHTGELRLKT